MMIILMFMCVDDDVVDDICEDANDVCDDDLDNIEMKMWALSVSLTNHQSFDWVGRFSGIRLLVPPLCERGAEATWL